MQQQQSQLVARDKEKDEDLGIDEHYQIPDELWDRIRILIPPPPPKRNKDRPGRPRKDDRKAMNGIFYVLRTGCQWKALPREYGSGSTCHRRFQQWVREGVFERIWIKLLKRYDDIQGIKWKWQSLDSSTVKAPLGGTGRVKTLLIVRS